MAARSAGCIVSYGVAEGVISIVPPSRALMLPEVPWLIPSVFMARAAAMMAWRRSSSVMDRPGGSMARAAHGLGGGGRRMA